MADLFPVPDFDQIVSELSQELLEKIKDRTPVDTGKAQAGWKLDDNVIYNDVEYIEYLENGTPKMAPVGMVRLALEEADDILQKIVDKHFQ